jgi:ribosomal protein L11 methyltransferase
MKWTQVKVIFDFHDKALAADLISDVFYDLGLQGVVVESPEMAPEEGWGEDALPVPEVDAVSGYFPGNTEGDRKISALEDGVRTLGRRTGITTRILCQELDEEDWAESWKAYFWPEKISDKIVVKPTWRPYVPESPEDIILEIDPGMAFGTGTHPTTSLCIQMLETYLTRGVSFLDIGTGSGILMIAAGKLGAGPMVGVDNDSVAVDVARENLLKNGIAAGAADIFSGDLVDCVDRKFDLVAANILSEVILVLLDDIRKVLKPGGVFICSGIISENRDKVTEKMTGLGFEVLEVREKNSWVAIAGRLVQRDPHEVGDIIR